MDDSCAHLVVVQCRYNSSRLAGKALYPLAGVPMLAYLLRRLLAGALEASLCLATTTRPDDDAVAAWGQALGVAVVRGASEDVLGRYVQCLDRFQPRGVIRVTADNPFTSLELVRLALEGLQNGADYVDAVTGSPCGAGVDAFRAKVVRQMATQATDPAEREHINLPILRHPQGYAVHTPEFPAAWRRPECRLTVDGPEDYANAVRIAGENAPEELLDLHAILARALRRTS